MEQLEKCFFLFVFIQWLLCKAGEQHRFRDSPSFCLILALKRKDVRVFIAVGDYNRQQCGFFYLIYKFLKFSVLGQSNMVNLIKPKTRISDRVVVLIGVSLTEPQTESSESSFDEALPWSLPSSCLISCSKDSFRLVQ